MGIIAKAVSKLYLYKLLISKGFMKKINIFIVLLATTLLLSGCSFITGRNAEHTGFITAVSQEGLIFQNYRIYFKTDMSSSQEDVYCLHRDNIEFANKLKQASKEKKMVTIKSYSKDGFIIQDCVGWTVESVEEVN